MLHIIWPLTVLAEEPVSDVELLEAAIQPPDANGNNSVSFMESGSSNPLVRYNPLRLGFGGLMYIYQRYISPQLPSECLYHPSCSGYSKKLIQEYGLVRGVLATADRLMRCNRMSALDIRPSEVAPAYGKVREDVKRYKSSP